MIHENARNEPTKLQIDNEVLSQKADASYLICRKSSKTTGSNTDRQCLKKHSCLPNDLSVPDASQSVKRS